MPYQPTYPSPHMETIDVRQAGGNVFKCLINPKDTVIGAKINIFYHNQELNVEVCSGKVPWCTYYGDRTSYIPIGYDETIYIDLKNRFNNGEKLEVHHSYGVSTILGVSTKYYDGYNYIWLDVDWVNSKIGNKDDYAVYSNIVKTFEIDNSLFPFKGGISDESWLQESIDLRDLYNGAEYNWNIALNTLDRRVILFGNQVKNMYETLDTLSVTVNTSLTYGDIAFLNSEIEAGIEYYFSMDGDNIKIASFSSFSINSGQIRLDLERNLSSIPTANTFFEIYATSSIVTSALYYFKARKIPDITFEVPTIIDASVYDFSATYEQEQHIGIGYYEFNLYSYGDLIDSSGHIFSQDIKYNCRNLISGKDYSIELIVVTDDGVEVRQEPTFSVLYEETLVSGSVITTNVDNQNGCIFVNYSGVEFSANTPYQKHINGYIVQRYEQESGKLYPVCVLDKDCTSFYDYNIQNHKTYRYKITPIFEVLYSHTITVDGKTTVVQKKQEVFGTPVNTSAVKTDWDGWSIIGLKPTSKFNEYTVDEDNIWVFEYNANGEPVKPVFNKAYATGFGQYPKEIRGQENYLEGSVSGLIGSISCNGEYINDDIDAIERWQAFCNDGNMKLLKDPKGYVIPCSIKDTAPTINYNVLEQITNISFSFVQLADRNDISVYGLEV